MHLLYDISGYNNWLARISNPHFWGPIWVCSVTFDNLGNPNSPCPYQARWSQRVNLNGQMVYCKHNHLIIQDLPSFASDEPLVNPNLWSHVLGFNQDLATSCEPPDPPLHPGLPLPIPGSDVCAYPASPHDLRAHRHPATQHRLRLRAPPSANGPVACKVVPIASQEEGRIEEAPG